MRTIALAITLLLAASGAFAQVDIGDCDPEALPAKCTLDQAYEFYRIVVFAKPGVDDAKKETTNENRAVEVPDAFAGRVHNTYQDFLNLFGFAINKVEESDDGQALTVRFNPFRSGLIAAGANLTVSRPVVSEALENDLPESGRADLLTRLQKQMGDLDSISWSASTALQTRRCTFAHTESRACLGRQPDTYRHLLSVALAPRLGASPDVDKRDVILALDAIATQEAADDGNLLDASLATGTTNVDVARAQLRELAERDAVGVARNQAFFAGENLDRVAQLIDNQPQATLSATYNAPGRYGGPEGSTYTFEFQYGPDNLNAIRAKCRGRISCLQTEMQSRLDNGVNTLKWVVSASYKRNNKWVVPDLGEGDPVEEFDGFTLDRSTEFSLKAQGGWKLRAEMGGENMRIDFSLEGQQLEVGDVRKKNRWIAAGTFTMPMTEQMSIPLTISWANKTEFLPDDAEKLGVHLGISYRLPDVKPSSLFTRR